MLYRFWLKARPSVNLLYRRCTESSALLFGNEAHLRCMKNETAFGYEASLRLWSEPSAHGGAPCNQGRVQKGRENLVPFDIDEKNNVFDYEAARTNIRNLNKSGTAEQKKKVKELIAATGVKLDQIEDEDVLNEILAVFE